MLVLKFKPSLFILLLSLGFSANYATTLKTKTSLSLDEAILLAVRSNPNVQSTKLNYIAQKFNLFVQEWQFYPHYSLQASGFFNRNAMPNEPFIGSNHYNIQPGISILTPIGTSISINSNNPQETNYNPSLSAQFIQPLMRGFGRAVVEAALNNARDTETIARLNIEGTLRNTVSNVINAYLDVISARRNIDISKEALERASQSVTQTKLFIKAGHLAGNELVTVQANVESANAQLAVALNNLNQTRYALLTAIGVDPNSEFVFSSLDIHKLIQKYTVPSLAMAKKLILANDIQYQVDKITLYGPTTRNLLVAKDNTRWILNVTANAITGNGVGNGQNAGFNSLFNGSNQMQGVGLSLTIPIDDQLAKQAVVNAKVALQQAELSLLQEKWSKETNAINAWNNVGTAIRAMRFAESAENLQERTYDISYQRYLHGLIDSLELQSAQLQLIQSQQTLLTAQIAYLKSLVYLDLLIGNTLNTWHIKIKGCDG
jgi:outer membrane protein TolC